MVSNPFLHFFLTHSSPASDCPDFEAVIMHKKLNKWFHFGLGSLSVYVPSLCTETECAPSKSKQHRLK